MASYISNVTTTKNTDGSVTVKAICYFEYSTNNRQMQVDYPSGSNKFYYSNILYGTGGLSAGTYTFTVTLPSSVVDGGNATIRINYQIQGETTWNGSSMVENVSVPEGSSSGGGSGDTGGGDTTTTYYWGQYNLTNSSYFTQLSGGTTVSTTAATIYGGNWREGYTYKGYVCSTSFSNCITLARNGNYTGTGTSCSSHTATNKYIIFFFEEEDTTPTSWQDPIELLGMKQGQTQSGTFSCSLPGYQAGYVWGVAPADFDYDNYVRYVLITRFSNFPFTDEYHAFRGHSPALNGKLNSTYIESAGTGTIVSNAISKTYTNAESFGYNIEGIWTTDKSFNSDKTKNCLSVYYAFPFSGTEVRNFDIKLFIAYICYLYLYPNGGSWSNDNNTTYKLSTEQIIGTSSVHENLTYPSYFSALSREGYLFKGYANSSTAKLPTVRKVTTTYQSIAGKIDLYAVWWPEFNWSSYTYTEANTLAGYVRDAFSLTTSELPVLSEGSVISASWYNAIMGHLDGPMVKVGDVITISQLDALRQAYIDY